MYVYLDLIVREKQNNRKLKIGYIFHFLPPRLAIVNCKIDTPNKFYRLDSTPIFYGVQIFFVFF
jgi:DNA modification methylase